MTRLSSPLARAAVVGGMLLALAACNREAPAPSPEGPALQESAPAETAAPPIAVASVKFGRYVEPKTFAVGGLGTKFKSSDSLFATVQLEGTAERVSVAIRLLDSARQTVAEQTREVQPKQPMKVNFALSQAATAALTPGDYTAETLLDGQVVSTTQITLQ